MMTILSKANKDRIMIIEDSTLLKIQELEKKTTELGEPIDNTNLVNIANKFKKSSSKEQI